MAEHEKPQSMTSGPEAALVVEDTELPEMGPTDALITMDDGLAGSAMVSDPDAPEMSEAAPEDAGPQVEADTEAEPEQEYPDMEPIPNDVAAQIVGQSAADFDARDVGDAYLRLVVQVDDGVMSIADGSVVDGPLAVQPDLTGEMAYQATIEGRRVGADAFPNLREIHSIAPEDDPDKGHHHGELSSFDFVVRIPREDITLDDLERLKIELIETRETTELSKSIAPDPGQTFEAAAAARSLAEPQVYSQIEGVSLDQLPSASVEKIRNGLK